MKAESNKKRLSVSPLVRKPKVIISQRNGRSLLDGLADFAAGFESAAVLPAVAPPETALSSTRLVHPAGIWYSRRYNFQCAKVGGVWHYSAARSEQPDSQLLRQLAFYHKEQKQGEREKKRGRPPFPTSPQCVSIYGEGIRKGFVDWMEIDALGLKYFPDYRGVTVSQKRLHRNVKNSWQKALKKQRPN